MIAVASDVKINCVPSDKRVESPGHSVALKGRGRRYGYRPPADAGRRAVSLCVCSISGHLTQEEGDWGIALAGRRQSALHSVLRLGVASFAGKGRRALAAKTVGMRLSIVMIEKIFGTKYPARAITSASRPAKRRSARDQELTIRRAPHDDRRRRRCRATASGNARL